MRLFGLMRKKKLKCKENGVKRILKLKKLKSIMSK